MTSQSTLRNTFMNLLLHGFARAHRTLLRATKGKWGQGAGIVQMFLLVHQGRKSGETRYTPLVYTTLGDAYIIAASYRGNQRHPTWYWNLREQKEAEVQVGGAIRRVKVTELEGEARERAWAAMVSAWSGFNKYERATARHIPVFELLPLD